LLISDIDKGGSFASLAGTMSLIEKKYQKLVKGFLLNKFRGDIDVLKPGFKKIKQLTGIPVLGTIPMIQMNIPEEDSLNAKPKEIKWTKNNISKIDKELDKLAKTVKNNVDLKIIERMIK
jgi:adenosylcobyric acid synthase